MEEFRTRYSCWNYAKYNTQAWAGSIGCGTAGTDYDANTFTHSIITGSGWQTVSLNPTWLTNWRDGIWVNNGFRLQAPIPYPSVYFTSSENVSLQPYVEIKYIIPGSSGPTNFIYFKLI